MRWMLALSGYTLTSWCTARPQLEAHPCTAACSAFTVPHIPTLPSLDTVMGYFCRAPWWLNASLSSTRTDALLQDGHFVDNWTFGPCVVEAVQRHIRRQRQKEVFCDCHLYATAPQDWVEVRCDS